MSCSCNLRRAISDTGHHARSRVGDLRLRKEIDSRPPLLLGTVRRCLAAAEGDVWVDARGGKVDHHHANVSAALEIGGMSKVPASSSSIVACYPVSPWPAS